MKKNESNLIKYTQDYFSKYYEDKLTEEDAMTVQHRPSLYPTHWVGIGLLSGGINF